jgi:hypothetical protein
MVPEMKVTIMMKYYSVCYPIPNILIPQTASERDLINACWKSVDMRQVKDPDILSLPREHTEFIAHDGNGDSVPETEDGLVIYFSPKSKTSPEMVQVTITWDGFDRQGLSFMPSIKPKIHRMEPRNSLLRRWKAHYGTRPGTQKIVVRLYDEEEEYIWSNHYGHEAGPPWVPE